VLDSDYRSGARFVIELPLDVAEHTP
jgi:hypothetical protein